MTQPLALLLYEKLLPGTQLVNRLQDTGWRVETLHDGAALTQRAAELKPLLVLADLAAAQNGAFHGISDLRRSPETKHIPVIAFAATVDQVVSEAALAAGATLVVSDTAVLQHLNQFIDQALSEF